MKRTAINCDRIFVEGATEKIILSKLGFNEGNVEVKFGKEEVIKELEKYLSSSMPISKKGNVCFVIDGDEEGYEGVSGRLKKDVEELEYSPPYIKMCKNNLCYVLVSVDNNFIHLKYLHLLSPPYLTSTLGCKGCYIL